jgi:galactokinase/mevalonate kinase-like predicted kinase
VRRLREREVRVESADLGRSCVISDIAEIRAAKDPSDWCALVKSALTVTGFAFTGGGLDIRISADVPKGSGMGTSSILGAALITALESAAGRKVDWKRVSALTLALEREMQTGGGWQDQIGGLLPGAKLVETQPGQRQNPRVTLLSARAEAAFAEFLSRRALLYFTGRKRMARNILKGVIDFFRENPDDIAREIVRRLKSDAVRAFNAAEAEDWDAFCSAVNDYWLAKKALDPGSTNPLVELIIARMAPWISAVSLCGAGGGGFMFVIARSEEAKAKIRATLENHPPIRTGRFFEFEVAK